MPNNVRQNGFTLLELLVAFVILSLAVAVLMRSFGQDLRSATVTGDYTTATLHAESILAGVGVDQPFGDGDRSGEFKDGYRWHVGIQPYQDPNGPPSRENAGITADRVVVTVSWGSRSSPHTIRLQTLRLAVNQK